MGFWITWTPRLIPYEAQADTEEKMAARAAALERGKAPSRGT